MTFGGTRLAVYKLGLWFAYNAPSQRKGRYSKRQAKDIPGEAAM